MKRMFFSDSAALSLLVVALFLAQQARSQAPTASAPVEITVPSFPVPESPAGSAIANNSEPTLRPSTPKEFAASLVGLVDRKGKIQPGVVIQYRLGSPVKRMPKDYQSNMLTRIRLNSEISFATTLAEQDSASGKRAQKSALGLKVPIIDNTDPRLPISGFSKCAEEAYGKGIVVPKGAKHPVDENDNPITGLNDADLKKALADCSKKHWDNVGANPAKYDSLIFAIAQSWADQGTDEKANYQKDARYVWLVYSTGFGVDSKILFQDDRPSVPCHDAVVRVPSPRGPISS